MDPVTETAVNVATQAAGAGEIASTFDTATILHLLWIGRLTVVPLALCSVIGLAVIIQQLVRYAGIDRRSRDLTRGVVDALVKHDLVTARSLCESAKTPLAGIFLEGLRWRNIALEDLNSVLATSRSEAVTELRRGLWILGTIGSLAPFIGLFGTVWGILKAFHDMSVQGSGGFAVVAAGISEALVATAVGLLVAALRRVGEPRVRRGEVRGGAPWPPAPCLAETMPTATGSSPRSTSPRSRTSSSSC